MTSIEVTGKTIEEAIKSGLAKLQRKEQDVLTEVITEPSSGIFGFGKRDAKVRLTVIEKEITPDTLTEAVMTESVAEPKEMTVKKKEETSAENIATEGKEFLQEVLEKMGISVVIEKMIKEDKIFIVISHILLPRCVIVLEFWIVDLHIVTRTGFADNENDSSRRFSRCRILCVQIE